MDICAIIERETGQTVTAETPLDKLGLDSLEFLDLMVVLEVPQEAVPSMRAVGDLIGQYSS